MKNFYNQVVSSVYNKKFYKELNNTDTSFTIFYLVKLSLVSGLIFTVITSLFLINFKNEIYSKLGSENTSQFLSEYININFPEDLVIQIKDGRLVTNKSEPVIFPIPTQISEMINQGNDDLALPNNLVVIDPSQEFSREALTLFNSYLLFASSSLGILDENDRIKEILYSDFDEEFKEIEITKDITLQKTEELSKVMESSVPFVLFALFASLFVFSIIFLFVYSLVFAIFSAAVAKIISLILKSKTTYGTWYLKSIHANTFYTIISALSGWIIPIFGIFFLNLIIVFIILFINDSFKD